MLTKEIYQDVQELIAPSLVTQKMEKKLELECHLELEKLSLDTPPATIPIIALECPETVFLAPDGILTLVFFPSSE
jgi:hypothetical protein